VVPTTDTITCRANASILDTPVTVGILTITQESGAVTATRSGSKATCTIPITYSWTLVNGPTDQMSLSYGISFGPGVAAPSPLLSRNSGQGLGNFAIPANGTTTNLAVTILKKVIYSVFAEGADELLRCPAPMPPQEKRLPSIASSIITRS